MARDVRYLNKSGCLIYGSSTDKEYVELNMTKTKRREAEEAAQKRSREVVCFVFGVILGACIAWSAYYYLGEASYLRQNKALCKTIARLEIRNSHLEDRNSNSECIIAQQTNWEQLYLSSQKRVKQLQTETPRWLGTSVVLGEAKQ